jgi:hypothetical protein
VYVEPGTTVNTYYKYGPTTDDTNPHWYPFLFDGTTGAVISADHIDLYFVDGQRGDDDLRANGQIVDAGGPGFREHPWQNPLSPCDVDNNGRVEALDVLLVINDLNAHQARPLPLVPQGASRLPPYLDVSGNNSLAPVDVLLVINHINGQRLLARGSVEGEPVTDIASSLVPVLPLAPNQPARTARHDVHLRLATCAPRETIRPANSKLRNAVLGKTSGARDWVSGPAMQNLAPADVDQAFAGLEAILADIAEDVCRVLEARP